MISVIIPAYNEEKRIGKTLAAYGEFFEQKKKRKEINDFEILIVINNTKDRTEEVVKTFSKKYKEIRYLNFKLGGKGFAIIEGFKEALKNKENKLIGFVDGDLSTPPEAFYDLIKRLDGYDGIIANRWDKRSIIAAKQSTLRRFVSRGYNLIIRSLFLFSYPDTQCGAKIFKREVLERNIHKLVTSNWGFDVALLFCLKKEEHARIRSVPTTWNDSKESHIDIKRTPVLMFLSAIRLRLIHSPLKFVVRFYRKIPKKFKIKV